MGFQVVFPIPLKKRKKKKALFFADNRTCTFMEKIQLMKKEKEKHTKSQRQPINIVLGKMELLLSAKHYAKCYLTSSSQKPWEAGYFYYPWCKDEEREGGTERGRKGP